MVAHASICKSLKNPLPADVLNYASFYWVTDRIEADCRFIGLQSAIGMVNITVSTQVGTAMARGNHPNLSDYYTINEEIDNAAEPLGEAAFCPAMYKLLGPDGTLMPDAVRINRLIKSAQERVRNEDR